MTTSGRPALRVTALVLAALVAVEAAIAVTAGVASSVGWRALAGSYVISDLGVGVTLAVAGWPVAWWRPLNPIGWLLLGGGLAYATSAAGYAALGWAHVTGHGAGAWHLVAGVASYSWPWAIGFGVPAVLLVFPDGRLAGPRWRWALRAAGVFAVVFTLSFAVPPGQLPEIAGGGPYPTIPGLGRVAGLLGAAQSVLSILVLGSALASLIVRYRRGDERTRRQLMWPALAFLVVLTGMSGLLWPQLGAIGIIGIALLPLSITVAVLRYQLLDIRLVVSRSVLYLLLTAAVIGGYVAVVAILDAAVRQRSGLGSSIVATIVVAVGFNPLRAWLQRGVNRVFYGARQDPVRALTEVGARLGQVATPAGSGLTGVLAALCQVMRWPSATLTAGGRELAQYGSPPATRHAVDLMQGDDMIGQLVIGLRSGEQQPTAGDERVLALLAAPLAVAVHATMLSGELTAARGRLILAREEERRRLRRDLHDGLGPTLTGVVLKADAARLLAHSDADKTAALLTELRSSVTDAVNDIRNLVYNLRPPELDGLGLAGSLREHAQRLTHRVDGSPLAVRIDAPGLAELPAAVEIAAYRIATEALTNVARHSAASAATVSVTTDGSTLCLQISDNGLAAESGTWSPGVGLASMAERAAELGGHCQAGPSRHGGVVTVKIPLEAYQ